MAGSRLLPAPAVEPALRHRVAAECCARAQAEVAPVLCARRVQRAAAAPEALAAVGLRDSPRCAWRGLPAVGVALAAVARPGCRQAAVEEAARVQQRGAAARPAAAVARASARAKAPPDSTTGVAAPRSPWAAGSTACSRLLRRNHAAARTASSSR